MANFTRLSQFIHNILLSKTFTDSDKKAFSLAPPHSEISHLVHSQHNVMLTVWCLAWFFAFFLEAVWHTIGAVILAVIGCHRTLIHQTNNTG